MSEASRRRKRRRDDRWRHQGWGPKRPREPFRSWNRRHNGRARGSFSTAQSASGRSFEDCSEIDSCDYYACASQGVVEDTDCVAPYPALPDGTYACFEYIFADNVCGGRLFGNLVCDEDRYCSRTTRYGGRCSGPPNCQEVRPSPPPA